MADPATEMYRSRADALATEAGDGPPLLCAHGSLMDRTMFAPQLAALSDEYRVAAYDLRARTERFAAAYDLDDLAADCLAVADGLDMDAPVLAGMSMGGFTALRVALRAPDRIAGLVLIDSIAEPHPESDRELYRGMIEQIRDETTVPRSMAETVTHYLFGETTREERPDLVERWIDRWTTYPGEAVYREVDSWLGRADVTERLAALDVPTLVIHGAEDASLDPSQAEPMAEALDARLETIPEAGHSANLERPEPVNRAIRAFLDDVYA
ncbi:alpha/beta fold hydrolase [Halostella salina]|uniref:alpha/beta fold hydrolase n=1 Tax=Halostella salina TaxID=1547897 RepID=UPI000EF83731|nr:alpha/beta hydrolase [Halostella salina]